VKAGDGGKAGEGGVLVADFFYGISCQASLLPASPPLPPFFGSWLVGALRSEE
jgi:hypothetical protein